MGATGASAQNRRHAAAQRDRHAGATATEPATAAALVPRWVTRSAPFAADAADAATKRTARVCMSDLDLFCLAWRSLSRSMTELPGKQLLQQHVQDQSRISRLAASQF